MFKLFKISIKNQEITHGEIYNIHTKMKLNVIKWFSFADIDFEIYWQFSEMSPSTIYVPKQMPDVTYLRRNVDVASVRKEYITLTWPNYFALT